MTAKARGSQPANGLPPLEVKKRGKEDAPRPMGTPRQLLNMCMAEVYRYRLAMQEQLPRIHLAVEELRGKPDNDVMARILDRNIVEKARAMTEVQFFFVAVRGILTMAEGMQSLSRNGVFPDVHRRVGQAIGQFNREAPNAKHIRDFLTHLDRYIAGTGNNELPMAEHRIWLVTPDEDLGLFVGGVVISVAETAAATERFAEALIEAIRALERTKRTPKNE